MRIVIVTNIFPPGFVGGYELGALDVSQALQRAGHDVLVVTSDYFTDDENSMTDLAVERTLECVSPSRSILPSDEVISRGLFIDGRNIRALAQTLIRFAPDRVICFNLAGLGVLGLIQYLVRINLRPILYLMDDVFQTLSTLTGRFRRFCRTFGSLQFLDNVEFILMSQNLCAQVEASVGRTLIHKTIIPGWFSAQLCAKNLPPRVVTTDRKVRFIFASQVAAHKGIDLAVEAVHFVVKCGRSDFVLDFFGPGEVGRVLQHVHSRGLQNIVRYQGTPEKTTLLHLLPAYDALIFPTWEREPFGFVVSEAAWAGCIPIMTAGIGAAEWFIDGFDCFKIARTATDVAAAMLRILSLCAEDRTTMQARAQNTAGRFLRFDPVIETVQSLLNESGDYGKHLACGRVRTAELALSVLDDMWKKATNA